jgi:prepilin-type N-terminal cleavage/methylation domain-containing protein
MKTTNYNYGFSLLEVIISIFILGIIATTVVPAIGSSVVNIITAGKQDQALNTAANFTEIIQQEVISKNEELTEEEWEDLEEETIYFRDNSVGIEYSNCAAVELILTIAIVSIVMLGLNSIFVSGYSNYILGNDKAEIQRSIRLIDKIVNDNIRYTESIKIKNNTRPFGESSYDEIFELESNSNGANKLIYNDRAITDHIISDITNINISSSSLEFKLEFIDGTEMRIKTLLNNME